MGNFIVVHNLDFSGAFNISIIKVEAVTIKPKTNYYGRNY